MNHDVNHKQPLIVLTGPTAVGKTDLSIAFAKAVGGEIISADSIQVYIGMDIGSAKITKEEMDGVKHHLIDILDPSEAFDVVRFQQLAKKAMQEIYDRGHIPIITGGTGFYIQSVIYDIDFTEQENHLVRDKYIDIAKTQGEEVLHGMLAKVDPEYAKGVHCHNVRKVARALEFYEQTKTKLSDHNNLQREKEPAYDLLYFVLCRDRETLYQRIDMRVDQMCEAGLVEEVANLRTKGYGRDLVSMQGLGYKEIYGYLEGECTLEEAIRCIKLNTRHFAKRQMTWFRREKVVEFFRYEDYENSREQMLQALLSRVNHHGLLK